MNPPSWDSYECSERNQRSSGSEHRVLTKCRSEQNVDRSIDKMQIKQIIAVPGVTKQNCFKKLICNKTNRHGHWPKYKELEYFQKITSIAIHD